MIYLFHFKMKFMLLICTSFIAFENVHAAEERSFLDSFIAQYRFFRIIQQSIIEGTRPTRRTEKYQPKISNNIKFPCLLNNTRSEQVPESVHKLRPGDIKIIGTIGDSLSAGLGVTSTNLINLGIEQRGLSFADGGQSTWREFLTFPNILKVFNPDLIGYSLKPSLSSEKESQFNVAETGAISANTPYMANILIRRIKNDHRVDLKRDWKMINIFIGANDFCSEICYTDPPELILENHKNDLLQVLRLLRDNLPRTFVNLIPPPKVDQLTKFKGLPNECYVSLSLFCPCIVGLVHRKFTERYTNIITKWQQLEIEIASYKEFDRDDFQVISQPFFVNFTAPTTLTGFTDFSYFAADCFHFSQKGGALAAKLLWNILLTPVDQKQFTLKGNNLLNLNCPHEGSPYFYTKRNSAQTRTHTKSI